MLFRSWTLSQMLGGFGRLDALLPGLLNLVAVGWMLALARERTGGLPFPIGIHAGWVFCIKAQTVFVAYAPDLNSALWGSSKVFDGYAASMVLALQLLVVHRLTRRPPLADAP